MIFSPFPAAKSNHAIVFYVKTFRAIFRMLIALSTNSVCISRLDR